ncbi:hypothetical protein RFI_34205, partial [Reticulomyxa filosa]
PCQLISIQQVISLIKELQSQLQTEKLRTSKDNAQTLKKEELKEINLENKKEIENLKENDNESKKEIEKLKENDNEKKKQIQQLNIQLKSEIGQAIIKFEKQLEQRRSACDACTNKLEGLVKSNDAQCKQIGKLN